ncbi:MAG: aminoacyl-tRNA hydrolase [Candidatus Saccharibacteria bacterium]|nr:aminoacyl-tRNA hydrolase [Candidatus Saccharibacteria bacterium]
MKLILAQGNLGPEYNNTRHNVGFKIIDDIAHTYQAQWREQKAFRALTCETFINGQKVLLVKPTTFYNLTGIALRTIADFYKLDFKRDLLVIHDDLALDFGTIKTRDTGSAGGNKGLQSIIAQIGIDFHRIKVGINNPKRSIIAKSDFVLSHFNKDELKAFPDISNQVQILVQNFISSKFDNSTYKLSEK